MSITSYMQNRTPITRRVWVDLTFQEMTLTHPLHNCVLDTEPTLIGKDLPDLLIDGHRARTPGLRLKLPSHLSWRRVDQSQVSESPPTENTGNPYRCSYPLLSLALTSLDHLLAVSCHWLATTRLCTAMGRSSVH